MMPYYTSLQRSRGWTPRELGANLLLWDIPRASKVTLSGSDIVTLTGSSNNVYDVATQPTGARRPDWVSSVAAFKNKPVIRNVSASQDFLSINHDAALVPATLTFWMALQWRAIPAATFSCVFGKTNTGGWVDGYGMVTATGAARYRFWISNYTIAANYAEDTSDIVINTPYIFIVGYDGANVTLRRNGVTVATTAHVAPIVYAGTPQLSINQIAGVSAWPDIDMAEFGMTNLGPSAGLYTNLESYLNGQYNVF